MSAPIAATLAVLAILVFGCASCERVSSEFTLDIKTLRQLNVENTSGITYSEHDGTVHVTVTDKYGDAHIHRLILEDVTLTQALDLLSRKQAELEQRK